MARRHNPFWVKLVPTRIRTWVGLTAGAGMLAWCAVPGTESRGLAAAALVLAGVVPAWIAARRLPAPQRRLYPALLVVAVLGELWAAETAYHTLGEIDAALIGLATFLNLPSLALVFRARPRWAYMWVGALFLLLVPQQVALMARWTRADREARTLIVFLERCRAEAGDYPPDLSGYRFEDASLRDAFHYDREPTRGYVLRYHLGSTTTSHDYSPVTGWFYYPD